MLLRGYTIVHQATRVLRITGRPEESTGPSLAQDILEKSTAGFRSPLIGKVVGDDLWVMSLAALVLSVDAQR